MRVLVEVVADDRDGVVLLLREIATNVKRRRELSGKEVNYCLGDYRVTVEDEPEASAPPLDAERRPK